MICNGKFTFGAEVDLNSNINVISKSTILLVFRLIGPSITGPLSHVSPTNFMFEIISYQRGGCVRDLSDMSKFVYISGVNSHPTS